MTITSMLEQVVLMLRVKRRRRTLLAAFLALLVAFHWVPTALAQWTFPSSDICTAHSGTSHGLGDFDHGGEPGHPRCPLCACGGLLLSVPPTVAAAQTPAICESDPPPIPAFAATPWAPACAQPPPAG